MHFLREEQTNDFRPNTTSKQNSNLCRTRLILSTRDSYPYPSCVRTRYTSIVYSTTTTTTTTATENTTVKTANGDDLRDQSSMKQNNRRSTSATNATGGKNKRSSRAKSKSNHDDGKKDYTSTTMVPSQSWRTMAWLSSGNRSSPSGSIQDHHGALRGRRVL